MRFPSSSSARRKRLYLSLDIEQLLANEGIDSNKLMPRHPDPYHPQTIEQGHDPLFPIYLPLKVSPFPWRASGQGVVVQDLSWEVRSERGPHSNYKHLHIKQDNYIIRAPRVLKHPRLGPEGPRTPGTLIFCVFPGSLGTLWVCFCPRLTHSHQKTAQLHCGVYTGLSDHYSGLTGMGGLEAEEGIIVAPLGSQWGNDPRRRKRANSQL